MAFPDGWGRRCELVTQHAQVEQDCTDFPMLVHEDSLPSEIFDADGSYPALNGGGDLRFSSDQAGSSQLPCEVESFVTDNDPANGKAAIWTKRTLSSASNTSTWIWYRKSGESQPAEDSAYGKEAVYDANYVMVQHMNQIPDGTADEMVDSTANDNDGTTSEMNNLDQVAGQINGSLEFDGYNDLISIGDITNSFSDEATLSMWIKTDAHIPDDLRQSGLVDMGLDADNYSDHYPYTDGDIYLGTFRNARLPLGDIGVVRTNWHLLTITNKPGANNWKVHQNQNEIYNNVGEDTISLPTTITIGKSHNLHHLDGLIDEVHISNIVRLAGWIATEYNSQYSPITFLIPETPETPVAYSEQFKDLLSEISAGIEELFDLSVEITATCAPFPRYVDLFTQMAVGVISFPSVRREFTVRKRTTDFTVVPRTTDFTVVPRTTDFTIVK